MLTQEQKATNYETYEHIRQVQLLLAKVHKDLHERALAHDQSKLSPPEVDTFTEFTPKLKHAEYGSDEYKSFLKQMKPALDNHYANNSHHPEHFANGIEDMNLLDVLEMFCDWLASTKRTKNGDILKSLEIQQSRFGISPQLIQIMRNTLPLLQAGD